MYVCISFTTTNADTRNNNATTHTDGATSIGTTKSSESIWQKPSPTRGKKTRKSERDVPHPIAIVVEISLLLGLPLRQHTLQIQFAQRRDKPIETQSLSHNSYRNCRALHHLHGWHCAYQRSRSDGSMKWPSI